MNTNQPHAVDLRPKPASYTVGEGGLLPSQLPAARDHQDLREYNQACMVPQQFGYDYEGSHPTPKFPSEQ